MLKFQPFELTTSDGYWVILPRHRHPQQINPNPIGWLLRTYGRAHYEFFPGSHGANLTAEEMKEIEQFAEERCDAYIKKQHDVDV